MLAGFKKGLSNLFFFAIILPVWRYEFMKTYKKNLPDGVKKIFTTERGVQVKVLNKKYYDKKKKSK